MAARNQPSYDFITGGASSPAQPPRQPLRETLRQSQFGQSQFNRPDPIIEELRTELNTLKYELNTLKQERELEGLEHQKELRDAEQKTEAEIRRAQVAENSKLAASAKYDSLLKEIKVTQTQADNTQIELERKVRSLSERNQELLEEAEEASNDRETQVRHAEHRVKEAESRQATLQLAFDELRRDFDAKAVALQAVQQKQTQQEGEVDRLEGEVLRLKSSGGDAEQLAVIKRELSEQVAHIKKLEVTNREQQAELKDYRRTQKSIGVVEEEKRTLEGKVRMMNDLRNELAEENLKVQRLEAEKKSWSAYLESQSAQEGELQFESPEELAKAFVEQRIENASLLERLGALQPELTVKEDNIKTLEEAKDALQAEFDQLRASGGTGDIKAKARLERQKALAVKEVDLLRAQLKNYDVEDSELSPEKYDAEKSKRIEDLEKLVDEHRKELQTLHTDLSSLETQAKQPHTPTQSPRKRSRESDDDEVFGELRRKNRALQDHYTKLQTRNAVLENELKATSTQLSALKASSRTRVLEFKNNPTAAHEAIKKTTLDTLKTENAALLSQLESQLAELSGEAQLVPLASLHSLRLELESQARAAASKEKSYQRLKTLYVGKANEFREAVFSILGWKLDFMPHGKVKVTSMFHPGDEESGENFIVFDGEQGTMKVSGGPQSEFAREIRAAIEFWVEGRKEIPCFLAALTMEFYERTTRAARA